MKTYKFALFDWDGCLSDTLSNAKRIIKALAKSKDIDLSEESLQEAFGDWDKVAKVSGFDDAKELQLQYGKMVGQSMREVKLNPNAKELLKNLHDKNIPIAIVTTSSKDWIIEQAKNEDVLKYINHVIGFEDVKNIKPDPESLELALKLLSATKSDSIMIGDTEKDINAANNANMDSIWYDSKINREFYGDSKVEELKPTYIVKDLIEIEKYF